MIDGTMLADTTPCVPVRTVAFYRGGKYRMAARLIERMAAVPHRTYVEPFVGMGGVFLRRPWRARVEVINDLSGDVATLFRVLQRQYVPFMDLLRWSLTSRAEFERLRDLVPDTLTDLERAYRFLYLQRVGFGGKVVGRTFGVSLWHAARFDVVILRPMLEAVHERLSGVVIERLPYAEVLARYDSSQTLFYLDPPYWGGERDYGNGMFERADFERLAVALAGIRGRFVLSLNDRPELRALFADHTIEQVEFRYTASVGATPPVGELTITGGGRPMPCKPSRLIGAVAQSAT